MEQAAKMQMPHLVVSARQVSQAHYVSLKVCENPDPVNVFGCGDQEEQLKYSPMCLFSDVCMSGPCQNGGTCAVVGPESYESFTCTCSSTYLGDACEKGWHWRHSNPFCTTVMHLVSVSFILEVMFASNLLSACVDIPIPISDSWSPVDSWMAGFPEYYNEFMKEIPCMDIPGSISFANGKVGSQYFQKTFSHLLSHTAIFSRIV